MNLSLSIFSSILNETLDYKLIFCVLASLLSGVILAIVYKFYRHKQGFSMDMPITIIVMPLIVCAIVFVSRIIGLNSSMDRTVLGFSLAGIVAITRFRSTQKDAIDLSFIMASIVLGFINGLGFIAVGGIVLLLLVLIYVLVSVSKFSLPSEKEMNLKITVPEDLNFDNLFDDILKQYCKSYNLKAIKTTDFGTLFEVVFIITLNNNAKQKEFIDKIRERNGNLNVSLSVRRYNQTLA